MADGFDRRMRRRSRLASIVRIAFAVFALAGIVGGAAMRFSRGCQHQTPVSGAPDRAPRR